MKTLKDWTIDKQKTLPEKVEKVPVIEEYEVTDEPFFEEDTQHHQNHQHPATPPAVLIMRRKAVRNYPGNKSVALYYIDKLDKYVTIPYDHLQWSAMPEEVGVLEKLKEIKESNQQQTIIHVDGSQSKIDVATASSILTVYRALNEENKAKVEEMAKESNIQMNKLTEFAKNYFK